ncbi:MAG TPA: hypothetical protein VN043_12155 [Rhodanobacter sp.]|nr:hypothetical protein [Rhodanobacter sp.]
MIKFKTMGISIVASTLFAAAGCVAQGATASIVTGATINTAVPSPVPQATQVKRCQDVGRFVKYAAGARDAGETEQHFAGRIGFYMVPDGGVRLIAQRLPQNMRAPASSDLLNKIFASNASPANWQKQVLTVCEKHISQA